MPWKASNRSSRSSAPGMRTILPSSSCGRLAPAPCRSTASTWLTRRTKPWTACSASRHHSAGNAGRNRFCPCARHARRHAHIAGSRVAECRARHSIRGRHRAGPQRVSIQRRCRSGTSVCTAANAISEVGGSGVLPRYRATVPQRFAVGRLARWKQHADLTTARSAGTLHGILRSLERACEPASRRGRGPNWRDCAGRKARTRRARRCASLTSK